MSRAESFFTYIKNELYCEGVAARSIAETAGTPVYVYSGGHIVSRFAEFERALGGYPHMLCYAVKANSNLAVLRLLARHNSGFDIVSGGELYRVLKAGGKPSRIVFSGVGKTATEIDYALRSGIQVFNCESESELRLLSDRARRLRTTARVALRVNPQVDAKTHPYISTGLEEHKFGIEMPLAEELFERAGEWPGLCLAGLSCHIGSQLTDLSPYGEAMEKLVEMSARLRKKKIVLEHLDVGGGLGIPYREGESAPSVADYVKKILRGVRKTGLKLLLEPGRSIVGGAGILLTCVVHTKTTGRKNFVIVDAAMNDMIRPALYDAYHQIRPVVRSAREEVVVDVVGPVCESADFFAQKRRLPRVEPGDLLAIDTVGAYGFVLSSNYNSRPRPPEVLVEGRRWRIARRRETLRDLIRGE